MQAAVQPQSFSAARAPGVLGSLSAMMGGGGRGRLSVLMGVVVHCKGSAGSLRTAARRGWCGPGVLTQGHQPTAPLGLTISLGSCALLIESPCDLNLMETTHRWPPCLSERELSPQRRCGLARRRVASERVGQQRIMELSSA